MREPSLLNEYHIENDFSDTSISLIKENYNFSKNVFFHQGWFPESIPENLHEKKFCFVHLDGDFYESTISGLDFFYPRMSQNGIIILDDYLSPTAPNVKLALNEMKDKYNFIHYVTDLEQVVIKKK